MRCTRRSLAHTQQVARGYARPRRVWLCLFYAFLIFVTVSCTSEDRIDAPKVATLATPPPDKVKPVEAVAPIPTPMDTFRALAPPEGMKFTPLFAEPVKDSDARFKRLEDSVQALRNDFDTVVPSLVRLVAVEKDMKNLVAQLQTLSDANAPPMPAAPPPPVAATPPLTPAPPKASPAEAPKPAVKEASAPAPKQISPNAAPPAKGSANPIPAAVAAKAPAPDSPEAASKGNQSPEGAASLPLKPLPMKTEAETPSAPPGAAAVKGLRAGDQNGATSIVIDLSAKSGYTASLAKDGKQLVVGLPGAAWTAKTSGTLKGSALAGAYKYADGKVTIDLATAAAIRSKQLLPPEGKSGYRILIRLVNAQQAPEKPQ